MLFKDVTSDLAKTASVYSVLGSGISVPMVKFDRRDGFYQADVRIPGIKKEAFKVEIKNRDIRVSYHIPFTTNEKALLFPVTVYEGPVPFDVDVKKIKANYLDALLQIILPFNDLAGGYSSDIKIAS